MILGMRFFLLFAFLLPFRLISSETPEALIRSALDEQVAAWNQGDLPRFVTTYAEHCTLVGVQISHVTRSEVLAHYREKYPNRARMGRLTFSGLEVTVLDAGNAMAVARWHLDRSSDAGGPVGGVFSLVFQKQNNSWVIILDHTS